jgi:hypothetical protein
MKMDAGGSFVHGQVRIVETAPLIEHRLQQGGNVEGAERARKTGASQQFSLSDELWTTRRFLESGHIFSDRKPPSWPTKSRRLIKRRATLSPAPYLWHNMPIV